MMHRNRWLTFLAMGAASLLSRSAALAGDVTLTMNGAPAKVGDYKPADIQSLVIANGDLVITFGKDTTGDFSGTSVKFKGTELAGNLNGVIPRDVDAKRTFYLDYGAGRGHLETDTVKILKNTPELAHFAVVDTHNNPQLEHHIVMLKDENGIHPYVIIRTPNGGGGGEMRTMYRFDMNILDTTWTNERIGKQPSYKILQAISERGNMGDETWKLADGTIYQKYDYCVYYAESPMFGHFGHGFGAFFIPVSNESYAGGPLRQELAVHQDALILNYIGGGHFSGGGTAAGRNGEKIHGPWFLYFSDGANDQEVIDKALKAAAAEKTKWPYQWVEEPLYPTKRTTVSGTLKVSHDRPASHAYVVLGQPSNGGGRGGRAGAAAPAAINVMAQEQAPAQPPARGNRGNRGNRAGRGGGGGTGAVQDRASILYNQAGDYLFYGKADANGHFSLPAVRPGTYTLYAWQTEGPITQSLAVDNVEVKGDMTDLGNVAWDAPYHPNLLWQFGKADRMAGEFKFGDQPRTNQWVAQVPADLTFTIGTSKERTDWYYAQHSGTWTVQFNVDKPLAGNAYLTVAIAGGGANVAFAVNGQEIGNISYGDDASVRRATNRSGRYARNEITFPASLLKQGANTLTLNANGAGIMYDTLVMEAD
jgi:rhamnogalacturonan endolyase